MVPVNKPAKRKLLAHKKSLIALAEKSTPIERNKKNLSATWRKLFKCFITARAACTEFNPYLRDES